MVYVLQDNHGVIRYVGVTADPADRLMRHIRDSWRSDTHRARWIRSMLRLGFHPTIHVVEESVRDWREAERRWIADLRAKGLDLVNATDGGDSVPVRARGTPFRFPHTRRWLSSVISYLSGVRKGQPPERVAEIDANINLIRDRVRRIRRLGRAHVLEARLAARTASARVAS